jgi:hypothetical protein
MMNQTDGIRDLPERRIHVISATESRFATWDSLSCNIHSRANQHDRALRDTEFRQHNRRRGVLLLTLCCGLLAALSACTGVSFTGAGTLTASPDKVAFGVVSVGQPATATVSFSNKGTASIEISQLNTTGQAFSLSSQIALPITISAGGTYSLQVRFEPSAAGAATGELILTSNSSTNPSAVISLSGTGTTGTPVPPALSALSCSSTSLFGSVSDACTVTLSAVAPSGGLTVSLSSNNTAVVVPATVTVAANAASATFTADVSRVASAQKVVLTASAASVSKVFDLDLNTAAPTLGVSATTVAFGDVKLNTAAAELVTLSSTGTEPVTISAATVTGASFAVSGISLPLTMNPGQAATLSVQFDPTIAGAATGELTLISNSSTNLSAVVSLSGTGTAGTSAPPVLNALSCSSTSMTGSVSDACTVTLSAAAPSGGLTVSLSSNNTAVVVPVTVMVAANAASATFTADVSWVASAKMVVLTASADSVSKVFDLRLNAATATLGVSATTVAFGDVTLNTAATEPVTLSSTGTEPVTVSAATVTGAGFGVSGISLPLTLNPGQAATLRVQFDPTVTGAATGQVALASNSSTNPSGVVSLGGTGESAAYQVDLTWDAPSSSEVPVAGYSVYRELSGSSTYQLLNSSAVSQTAYVDTTVQSGQTYNYIVESVDASGVESSPSNTYRATIP